MCVLGARGCSRLHVSVRRAQPGGSTYCGSTHVGDSQRREVLSLSSAVSAKPGRYDTRPDSRSVPLRCSHGPLVRRAAPYTPIRPYFTVSAVSFFRVDGYATRAPPV